MAYDPSEIEKQALLFASKQAGDYIEYLGKTDMALMTPKQWDDLIYCIGLGFCQKKMELEAQHKHLEPEVPY